MTKRTRCEAQLWEQALVLPVALLRVRSALQVLLVLRALEQALQALVRVLPVLEVVCWLLKALARLRVAVCSAARVFPVRWLAQVR